MSKYLKPALWVWLSLLSGASVAEQKMIIQENATLTIPVSYQALNRIRVEGDRIQGVKGLAGQFQLDKDPQLGQIFIQPLDTKEPIHVFLSTEQGNTYALNLAVREGLPSSIVLVPKNSNSLAKWEKSSGYEQLLVQLVKAMHNKTDLEGFSLETVNQKLPKFQGMSLSHVYSYTSATLEGQCLLLHNTTKNHIELKENDFHSSGIRAVAILNPILEPGSQTQVYRVRDK